MAVIKNGKNRKLGLLVALQLIVIFHLVSGSTLTNLNETLPELIGRIERDSGLGKDKRVMYDVTGIWDYHDGNSGPLSQKASSLMYSVATGKTCLSTHLDGGIMDNKIWSGRCESSVGYTSLSFLFSLDQYPRLVNIHNCPQIMTSNIISNLMDGHKPLINTLIISVKQITNLNCRCFSQTLLDYLVHDLKLVERKSTTFVKLGIEYPENLIDSCDNRGDFTTLRRVDLAVLRVEISPFTNLLSFGLFSERLDKITQNNNKFVRSLNPTCKIYVRLVFPNFNNLSDHVNSRYQNLVMDYFEVWEKEYKGEEVFIISAFSQNKSLQDNFEYLKTRVSPTVRLQNLQSGDENSFANKMKNVPSFFENIELDGFSKGEEILSRNFNHSLDALSKANLSIVVNQLGPEADGPKILKMLLDKTHLPKNIHTIYFGVWRKSWSSKELNSTANLLDTKNIKIGCYLEIDWKDFLKTSSDSSLVDKMKNECGPLLNVSTKILYYIRYGGVAQKNDVQFLWDMQRAREIIKTALPKIEPIPRIRSLPSAPKAMTHSTETLYCDRGKLYKNEYYQEIVTFAGIHGWSNVHLRYLIGDHFQGWWRDIITNKNVNKTTTAFPVFVHTNAAKPLKKDAKLPNTYNCVEWTKEASKSGIGFLRNDYSGTTVVMYLRDTFPISMGELEKMLFFALGKFPTVEIIAKSENDVVTVQNVVTAKFVQNVLSYNTFPNFLPESNIFMEIPIELAFNPTNNNHVLSSVKNMVVHFSGWEKYVDMPNQLNSIHNPRGRHFGITVADCVHEVNLKLTRLKKLPFLPKLKYVVCNVKPVVPSNFDRVGMNKYLNTMFYVKMYMEQFILKSEATGSGHVLEVTFRINLLSEGNCGFDSRPQTEKFLRFLNDVNQQSKAYKIKYFIVNSFEKEDMTQECSVSWWRIGNYTDLINDSVYTDREDEHFGRQTMLKTIPVTFNKKIIQKDNTMFAVIISCVSCSLLVFMLALWMNYNRLTKAYLTQKEVEDFLNGQPDGNKEENEDDEHCKWLGMEFPKSFQIQKRNIEVGRLVGAGQFGQVFIGKLNQEIDIAVKIPRESTSRDVFKSALAEVKILCFVGDGSHPNVVAFMGAYTKEIASGKLYVLTEYCHNGSLLDYLRASQTERGGDGDEANSSVDQYDMYRLAFEIASGMEYISGKRVIHGDLSTRNIFLSSEYTCKIGDFGLSRKLYQYNEYVKTSHDPLPWKWMAVESLKNLEFTTKSDVWSYGITVWEIFTLGSQPYPGLTWTPDYLNELENGMRLAKAKYASDSIHDKLMECWNLNPESRPAFPELTHYFAGLRNCAYTDAFEVLVENS